MSSKTTVAIIGAGSIGVSFAIVFASAGFRVKVFEPSPERLVAVPLELESKVTDLVEAGLYNEQAETILSRVSLFAEISEAIKGVDLVQECVPERIELKREIFSQFIDAVSPNAVLASSSSAITASKISAGLPIAHQTLIAHPGNPPHLLPLIEIVPSEHTESEILQSAREMYKSAGMLPITVQKEIEGFIFNRLQGAVLREAYALVRDRVADVEDIDSVVREGLGKRWSFMGPFETADLNTRGGIKSHAEKLGPAYARMGAERGQHDPWTPDLVSEVEHQRRAVLPLDKWDERVRWRDRQLLQIKLNSIQGRTT
ncbi:3-hydroxyacyl-CoA dehydrogenase [Corynebacterium hadale]|uniref:3-hydroxyacyl-CoA dehydrogenase n=1 Tax=Corynebacterium hadale TaxID=2026255 RepID=A0ABX4H9U7_9CORY|nr:3-hydroxyacyl-CoA dehydrogenase [Corynebacterium hadale]PAT06085.1 3-hydroxyacyl-CoA dehydrogenase [Corynebacterium hadale]